VSHRRQPVQDFAGSRIERRDTLDRASNALRRAFPERSAGSPLWFWQKLAGAGLAVGVAGGALIAPRSTIGTLFALLIPAFFCVAALRAVALGQLTGDRNPKRAKLRREEQLPSYSVIVPLYRESQIVSDLVDAMAGLDYPPVSLEVLLVTEQDDAETLGALRRLRLPANMHIMVVPRGEPRTKPRALNFALSFAVGDYVVVYDAEDVPESDQLRKAAAHFALGGERLGCVQARLNVYNSRDSWLTRGLMAQMPLAEDEMS
jgi:cellulose synthase/poly-beta-1,6-N-acetylglucosamine synthase-like glycosyltransferase